MGDVQTLPDYPKGLTFEHVWAALMEDREQIKASRIEFDRRMEETNRQMKEADDRRMKETDQRMKEADQRMKEANQRMKEIDQLRKEADDQRMKETDQRMKEIDQILEKTALSWEDTKQMVNQIGKRLGDFTNGFGDVIEAIITPGLIDKFYDMGLDFQTASPNFKVRDHKNKIYFEIDALLQNGDTAMLVEIKTNLSIRHINGHISRLDKMRAYADLRNDKRVFLGAVAGIVVPVEVKQYALEYGFYVIEPSGENFNITSPYNKPKEW
ncbi:MAG: hypothetical protein LBG94_10125 [Treponema sp.]|jgi:membrane-associated HD superfamily phosphohydrolase|nr:hypothetical protein [Treponema sp.]